MTSSGSFSIILCGRGVRDLHSNLHRNPNRWVQLAAGIVGMVAVANYQYAWTFFVEPIRLLFGWNKEEVQVAFTLFVLMETWLVPVEAYLVDRFGPFLIVLTGAVLAGLGWVINSAAGSLAQFYLGSALSGTGVGMVYASSMGSALKWFPDRRGLAAGLTAGGFGAGSALTVWPIRETIKQAGYQSAFLWFGLGQALVVVAVALVLRKPPEGGHHRQDVTPLKVLRTPVFWLLYVMMTLVTTGGLMIVAQLDPIARAYGVAEHKVQFLFLPALEVLTFAGILERLGSGLTRPIFGWISDQIGRELTMFVAFSLEGVMVLLLLGQAHVPERFVLLIGLTFFAWGEIFSLFPALVADIFGPRYATTCYGLLYTAKGMAALLVPLGNFVYDRTGSWSLVFGVAVVFDWITAVLALVVVPRVRRAFARTTETEGHRSDTWIQEGKDPDLRRNRASG